MLLLFSLPNTQGPLATLLGRELSRTFFPWGGEAKLDRITIELINAEVSLPLSRAVRHGVVDGHGLLGRINGELGLEIDLSRDGDGCLAILGDSLPSLDEFLGHRLPVGLARDHRPFALQLGNLFLGGVLRATGTNQKESSHERHK